MLPDLHHWWAGFVGIALALLFIDVLRLIVEVAVHAMRPAEFLRFRLCVLGSVLAILAVVTYQTFVALPAADAGRPGLFKLGSAWMSALTDLRWTTAGAALLAPFRVFSSVILNCSASVGPTTSLAAAGGLVWLSIVALTWLDRRSERRRRIIESARFGQAMKLKKSAADRASSVPIAIPRKLWGVGSIAWRQQRGAMFYGKSVLLAFLFPAVLSCAAIMVDQSVMVMLVYLVASLAFYTFVLLPAALVFDFRRDVDRIGVLKSLPISPWSTTLGQLAVPVSLSCGFQLVVLLAAMFVRPFHPAWLAGSMLILFPINVLIFALENLIFMWYPYRMNAEGVNVFLRISLTFTAKGVLFALGFLLVLVCSALARWLGVIVMPDSEWSTRVLFVATVCGMCSIAAAILVCLLVNAFRRFDASQDVPA